MNCPFCKAPPRTDWGYHCGTSRDAVPQRTNRCREAEVAALRQQIKRLREASCNLVNLVEGVGSVRWAYNGFRLKDTEEWCEFYVASNRAKEEKL